MGQKVNPHGLRVGIIKDWDSKWYADKDYEKFLLEDIKIREFIKEKLFLSGISKVEIERASNRARISIHTAKPGMVIGRQGSNIELLKNDLKKMTDSVIDINPGYGRNFGCREHCISIGTPYRFPPCNETMCWPYHAHGR